MYRLGRIIVTLSLATFIFTSGANATGDPALREILNKHWEAMGGMRNWSQIESIQLNGTIERDGQLVDIVIVKKRPNQIRATMTLPIPGKEDEKLQVIQAHDGKTAWTATRLAGAQEMRKEELSSKAAAELLADAGVLPRLIKAQRQGAKLEKIESKMIDRISLIRIRATREDSRTSYIFGLNSEDYRLARIEQECPDQGTTVTTYSDYERQEGVYVASNMTIHSPETGISRVTTEWIKVGVGIYEEYFTLEQ
ncbi:MAG: hypothetical protein AAF065_00115 [Verrucomicrobiota bacterium]